MKGWYKMIKSGEMIFRIVTVEPIDTMVANQIRKEINETCGVHLIKHQREKIGDRASSALQAFMRGNYGK